jgi:cytidylate kinase
MLPVISSERRADALELAIKHWGTQEAEAAGTTPARPPTKFTIALSREAGARGSTIAQRVGQLLGWPVYDRELIQKIADEKGLRTRLLESIDEKRSNWLQKCLEGLVIGPRVSEGAYLRYLSETMFSLAALGDCIIVGRGAAQVLPPDSTLRVRLIAPEKERITFISKRFALSEKDATQWVRQTDHDRNRFVKDYFHVDAGDLTNYDLVINVSRFSPEGAAHVIVQALAMRQLTKG